MHIRSQRGDSLLTIDEPLHALARAEVQCACSNEDLRERITLKYCVDEALFVRVRPDKTPLKERTDRPPSFLSREQCAPRCGTWLRVAPDTPQGDSNRDTGVP